MFIAEPPFGGDAPTQPRAGALFVKGFGSVTKRLAQHRQETTTSGESMNTRTIAIIALVLVVIVLAILLL